MRWRLIEPDPLEGGELPATEFVHPWPLLALLTLAINDHVFKGSGWLPGVVTGKLSDFAGLFFFPLLVTACADVLIYAVNVMSGRHRWDASLRTWKLVSAAVATGVLFSAIKLSPAAAQILIDAMQGLAPRWILPQPRIVQDLWDLTALPMLGLAVWFGRTRLAEIPPARLAYLRDRSAQGVAGQEAVWRELRDCARVGYRGGGARGLADDLADGLGALARGRVEDKAVARARQALSAWRTGCARKSAS